MTTSQELADETPALAVIALRLPIDLEALPLAPAAGLSVEAVPEPRPALLVCSLVAEDLGEVMVRDEMSESVRASPTFLSRLGS
ncbi:hypothetical protein [Anaeromyxobacter oryzae]|uniref:Uncharacterized protein n=1 Tax=Anaeromyxobacter oryzae TaxID=2918170 RepID=A0ABN6MT83_9BACT|nr:hypothetical protein [Anaeromyxobacter oryzae]BDG02850.1 hypothetical protein AMOR_18460 [Anaeromyxobacter oryzae]